MAVLEQQWFFVFFFFIWDNRKLMAEEAELCADVRAVSRAPPPQLQAAVPCAGAQFGEMGFCSRGFVQLAVPGCAELCHARCHRLRSR